MPRNNKSQKKQQQAKPWSDSLARDGRSETGPRSGRGGRSRRPRRVSVRSELRREPDVRRIARAVIGIAMAQAEAEAQQQAQQSDTSSTLEAER